MYLAALGRAARSDEVTAAIEFLETQGQEYGIPPQDVFVDPRPWADLGHVLWNTKEFFFVH